MSKDKNLPGDGALPDDAHAVELVQMNDLSDDDMANSKQSKSKMVDVPLADIDTKSVKSGEDEEGPFVPSHGITSEEADALLKQWGRNELVEKRTPSWLVFLQQLYQPMPIMIWIAIIIEAAIQNWLDMGILLMIQFCNATIGWYEITKAGNAVAALKATLKPVATVKRDGKWQTIDGALLVPGDMVLLASGSAIPADCKVNTGRIEVDQSALTGESLPVTIRDAGDARMGSTVTRGEVEGTVMATGMNTFFGKTATMIQAVDDSLGNLQKILLRIMIVLVVLSVTLCTVALIYLMTAKSQSFSDALSFAVVLLVASIPIAIEIVSTATLALGSRQLSEHGAIVTRLTSIEEMAGMNMLCSDKTGTLTLNKMVIQEFTPVFVPEMDQKELLKLAAMAAKWKEPARDALDTLVLGAAALDELEGFEMIDFMPFDPTVKRTEGTIRRPDGQVFKVTKGAKKNVIDLCANKDTVGAEVDRVVDDLAKRGIRCLCIAKADGQDAPYMMMGILTFLDPPRPDTKLTIERSMELGVDVKMITGDHGAIAKECARMLGMGTNIKSSRGLPSLEKDGKVPTLDPEFVQMILEADGFAEVYPEHKFIIVEALRQEGFAVGMTGDGVNDAPALKRADVGIAVSGATDAARAAADMVLTHEGLSVIVEAIIIARRIFQRIKSFITYRIAATLQLLFFFFISVFAYTPANYYEGWPEFFQMPVIMLMLITLLNDGTLISIGYDNVKPSPRPCKWNLKVVWLVSIVLGAVACLSSLLLLWMCLDSPQENSIFQSIGLPAMPYGNVITAIYLKVSVSDFLTLFSARTDSWFFSARPGWLLLGAGCFALALSTTLASVWPESSPDGVPVLGLCQGEYKIWPVWIWLYCLCWWIVQDACKVFTYWLVYRFDIFHAASGKYVNVREAETAADETHKMARASVGVVEGKLLSRKVDNAIDTIDALAKEDPDNPEYKKMKEDLQNVKKNVLSDLENARLSVPTEEPRRSWAGSSSARGSYSARKSVGARASATARFAPGTPTPRASTTASAMEMGAAASTPRVSVSGLPPAQRSLVEAQLEDVNRAAAEASEVAEITRTVNY